MSVLLLSLLIMRQGDPRQTLKQIEDIRTAALKRFDAMPKTEAHSFDWDKLLGEISAIARKSTEGNDVDALPPADAFAWAQLYQILNDEKAVRTLSEKALSTNPAPEEKFAMQMMLAGSLYSLGDGKTLGILIADAKPTSPAQATLISAVCHNIYAAAIEKALGPGKAVEVLDNQFAYMNANKLVTDEARYHLLAEKAEVLANSGDGDRARATLKEAHDTISTPELRKSLEQTSARLELVGKTALPLAFDREYGSFTNLAALKGKVVVIDTFAHWCVPCKASMPEMHKMYEDLHSKGLEIVGVTRYYGYYGTDQGLSRAEEFRRMGPFTKEHQLEWPVIFGEQKNFDNYHVAGIPTTFVVDRKGIIRNVRIGYTPEAFKEFRAVVERILDETP